MVGDSNIPNSERLQRIEAALAKSKARYDAEASIMKNLLLKRQVLRDMELLEAATRSELSHDEILSFINSRADAD